MRRILRPGGMIVFNAVVSDQLNEVDLQNHLEGLFPRRTLQILPRDIIDRTFAGPNFQILEVLDKEYFRIRRVS
jgi:hypothetical protein